MKKHFVTFWSPGTFCPEESTMPIESWDIKTALEMASGINERYNARPFGFSFSTRSRGPEDLDSKQTAKSPMYYLGGTVRTLAEVEAEANPDEKILLSNMRGNKIAHVITNTNSWKHTAEFKDGDVLLPAPEWAGKAVAAQ